MFQTNVKDHGKISIAATPHALRVLTDKLYSNPWKATIRELMANAWEATPKGGHDPIITLPSMIDPIFSVEDSGPGMSEKDIERYFCTLFGTTKVFEQVGGFGLGCKTPLAVTEQFSVISRHEGTQTIYNIFTHDPETEMPGYIVTSRVPCKTKTGLTVIVPVREEDLDKVQKEYCLIASLMPLSQTLFENPSLKMGPTLFIPHSHKKRTPQILTWTTLKCGKRIGYLYPMDTDYMWAFNHALNEKIALSSLYTEHATWVVPYSLVEPAPSRESLQIAPLQTLGTESISSINPIDLRIFELEMQENPSVKFHDWLLKPDLYTEDRSWERRSHSRTLRSLGSGRFYSKHDIVGRYTGLQSNMIIGPKAGATVPRIRATLTDLGYLSGSTHATVIATTRDLAEITSWVRTADLPNIQILDDWSKPAKKKEMMNPWDAPIRRPANPQKVLMNFKDGKLNLRVVSPQNRAFFNVDMKLISLTPNKINYGHIEAVAQELMLKFVPYVPDITIGFVKEHHMHRMKLHEADDRNPSFRPTLDASPSVNYMASTIIRLMTAETRFNTERQVVPTEDNMRELKAMILLERLRKKDKVLEQIFTPFTDSIKIAERQLKQDKDFLVNFQGTGIRFKTTDPSDVRVREDMITWMKAILADEILLLSPRGVLAARSLQCCLRSNRIDYTK